MFQEYNGRGDTYLYTVYYTVYTICLLIMIILIANKV